MRLAFFYGPVWLVIIATLTMYVATGIKIYQKGAGMRFFMSDSQHTTGHRDSAVFEEATSRPFAAGKSIVVTTQIQHDVQQHEHDTQSGPGEIDDVSLSSYSSTKNLSKFGQHEEIESSPRDLRVGLTSRDAIGPTPDRSDISLQAGACKATAFATSDFEDPEALQVRPASAVVHQRNAHARKAMLNDAALAYLKVAFLMFIALFVVWVCKSLCKCMASY